MENALVNGSFHQHTLEGLGGCAIGTSDRELSAFGQIACTKDLSWYSDCTNRVEQDKTKETGSFPSADQVNVLRIADFLAHPTRPKEPFTNEWWMQCCEADHWTFSFPLQDCFSGSGIRCTKHRLGGGGFKRACTKFGQMRVTCVSPLTRNWQQSTRGFAQKFSRNAQQVFHLCFTRVLQHIVTVFRRFTRFGTETLPQLMIIFLVICKVAFGP